MRAMLERVRSARVPFHLIDPQGTMSQHDILPTAASHLQPVGNQPPAAEAARRSELFNIAMLESSLDCIVTIDHHGHICEFNPAAERTFGWHRDQVVGKELADIIIPPALRAAHRQGFTRYLATGEARVLGKRVEMTAVRSDGTEFPVELAITRITLDGVPFFTGYLRDITDRKAAAEAHARRAREAALRADVSTVLARTGTLRAMLEGCTEALVKQLDITLARVWTLARGSGILELQASAGLYTTIEGRHSRVPVGEMMIGLIAQTREAQFASDADDPRIIDKTWARQEGMVAFAGYPLLVEGRVVGVMALSSRRPLPLDTVEALGSIADSIAQGIERKRSEDELRRSEAYLAEGQRLSHTGSWAVKVKTGERFWSREVFSIYGFEPFDTPPPLDAVRSRVHPKDLAAMERTIAKAFETATEFEADSRLVLPDGSMKYIHTVGHPVVGDDGELTEFIGTVIDVTDRKNAERRLRRAIRARYDAVLAERTRLARDMHDGLLQDVTGIALQLRAVLARLHSRPEESTSTLQAILDLAEETSREARRAVVDMRSGTMPEDFAGAVEHVARRVLAQTSLLLSLTVVGRARLVRPELRNAAILVVQEAVTNVVRHAGARTVQLVVAFTARGLRISVTDDGAGFATEEPEANSDHFGLVGMRERAAEVGASLSVQSAIGGGTAVTLRAPYQRRAEASNR